MKYLHFVIGIALLIGVEIAKVYYIMPFPGSQVDETIEIAYFIGRNIGWFRMAGIVLIIYPSFSLLTAKNQIQKWTAGALLAFWFLVLYAFNLRFMADTMFYQPRHKILVNNAANKVDKKKLVLGVMVNGQAKAYPIEIIGYHHQVQDTVGGQAIMITYCTVCRTGRAYLPRVDGTPENFRLVGMDHFNAMFEDSRTKSWWRQVNGLAIAGPLKGKQLKEVPSQQMTLGAWLNLNPASLILQPDRDFSDQYADLEKYDEGTIEGKLEGTDTLSWKEKSLVVGVAFGFVAKAYDWNDLKKIRVINDDLEGIPILLTLEKDSVSHYSFSPIVNQDTLIFSLSGEEMIDSKTQSLWSRSGKCIEGTLKGVQLPYIQSYQEFWHSWQTFHPNSTRYENSSVTLKK